MPAVAWAFAGGATAGWLAGSRSSGLAGLVAVAGLIYLAAR